MSVPQPCFMPGQLWISPRGFYYRVISVKDKKATLRMNINGTGKKVSRDETATKNWQLQ